MGAEVSEVFRRANQKGESMSVTNTVWCDVCNKEKEKTSTGRGWFEGDRDCAIECGWSVSTNNRQDGRDVCPECVYEMTGKAVK